MRLQKPVAGMPSPASHHPDDTGWIHEQLAQLPSGMRMAACDRYSSVYERVHAQHAPAVFADCRARREANTRLREFVSRALGTLGGHTAAPGTCQMEIAQSAVGRGTDAGDGTAGGNVKAKLSAGDAKGKSTDRSR